MENDNQKHEPKEVTKQEQKGTLLNPSDLMGRKHQHFKVIRL